jgi:DNA helicase-2/ATP-dependent DNA helicase PcrA
MEKLLEALNPVQRQIVEDTQGHILTLAGAGAGKTRTLTYRIAYLLSHGIKPWQIVAVTFTNKAARQMKERLVELSGAEARDVWVGTFHAICVRILVRFGDRIGIKDGKFTIIDDKEKVKLLKQCNDLCGTEYDTDTIANIVGAAKNAMVSPGELAGIAGSKQEKDLANLYQAYEDKKTELGYLDFDDLIFKTVLLFQNSTEVRDFYQNQFLYVMSDECQDQNKAQFTLLNYFSGHHENLFMVGDIDQSVYKWRGAEIGNMIRFKDEYPDCKIYRLEQNYRSTQVIVNASNALILHNKERLVKTSFTANREGDPILIHHADDDSREADFVSSVIQRMKQVDSARKFSDFAVLYRTNKQSRTIEVALTQRGIPYQVIGGTSFYDRKEIKDITAYLRVIDNEFDALALDRIINVPRRGIGDTTVNKIEDYAITCQIPFTKAVEMVEDIPAISKGTKLKIAEFIKLVYYLREQAKVMPIAELIMLIINETGYKDSYDSNKEDDQNRLENIEELVNVANTWDKENEDGKGLSDFLAETTLISDIDALDDTDYVKLMTVHGAKGLEFPVVFGIGIEENVFPHGRSLQDPKDIEEERRLMYVLLTRAEEKIFLSHCRNRYEYGSKVAVMNKRSRFISEIPQELYRRI